MTDHDALLQAVLAAPEDDLPRLVFADFLEESGHPANAVRARFIRLQIEAEGSPRKDELLAKAKELRPMFRDEWDEALPENRRNDLGVSYRKGLAHDSRTGLRYLLEFGERLFAVAPVSSLFLLGDIPSWEPWTWNRFLTLDYLSRVKSLRLGPRLRELLSTFNAGDVAWDPGSATSALFANLHLKQLRHLDLSSNRLDDVWIVAFVSRFPETSFNATLQELSLIRNTITDAGANALSTGRGLDDLTLLDLRDNRLTADGIAMLRRRFGDRVRV